MPISTVATAVTAMCKYCIGYYVIQILIVTISVHTVTNMYSSLGCASIAAVALHDSNPQSLYQCTLLPICTVATAVKAMCQYCSTVTLYHSNPHCHYISAHCYQYVR